MTQFNGRTKICYGDDAIDVLETIEASKALIVTDPFMVKAGFVARIESHLDRANITHALFDQVESDPSLETIKKGVLIYLQEKADLIIALGGGSAIDAAKAILLFGFKADGKSQKPTLAAIPTTSGTGSEVTAISVITDKENDVKLPLVDELMIPDVAVLDARFTRTVPKSVTAATGMDVLTHAIEAFTSRNASAFTQIYAEHAIRYVLSYLLRVYKNGDDMEAREHMLLASCMAGMAFNNSGLGITHSLAHSLGARFHVPHGLANAVLLTHVIRFNSFDVGVQYRKIAELIGFPSSTVEEGTQSLIHAVNWLNNQMEIPASISGIGISPDEFSNALDLMARHALEDACTPGNPRLPSVNDLKDIFEKAF